QPHRGRDHDVAAAQSGPGRLAPAGGEDGGHLRAGYRRRARGDRGPPPLSCRQRAARTPAPGPATGGDPARGGVQSPRPRAGPDPPWRAPGRTARARLPRRAGSVHRGGRTPSRVSPVCSVSTVQSRQTVVNVVWWTGKTGKTGETPVMTFDHVGIAVRHLGDAAQVYETLFGLTITERYELPAEGVRIAFVRSGAVDLEF